MLKEYKTISEVTGPLMLVKGVEGVGYDELGEIELPNGDIRHCRVLEINGNNVLVQLFENSAGINLAESKVRFLGHGISWPYPRICWDVSSMVWDTPSTAVRRSFRTKWLT